MWNVLDEPSSHHESEDVERKRWRWKEQGKCSHVFIVIGVVGQSSQSKTVHRSGRFSCSYHVNDGVFIDDLNNHNRRLVGNRWRRTYGKGIASSASSSSTSTTSALLGTIVKL